MEAWPLTMASKSAIPAVTTDPKLLKVSKAWKNVSDCVLFVGFVEFGKCRQASLCLLFLMPEMPSLLLFRNGLEVFV